MVNKRLLAITLGVLTAGCLQISAFADKLDLLHNVPLEISEHTTTLNIPEQVSSADQVLNILNASPNLLVHMEMMRRGYHHLPTSEQDKLVNELNKRYTAASSDPIKFFDHGYAQLVYKNNKTGLFFLRKANDKLRNQFSSLAYALAQADVDLYIENNPADTMTFRKLDVIYKLTDAVDYDARAHQSGFWPTFVRVSNELKKVGPYAEFTNTDFSERYLSYVGKVGTANTVSNPDSVEVSVEESTAIPPTAPASSSVCEPAILPPGEISAGQLFRSRKISLGEGRGHGTANFYTTQQTGQYKVVVTDAANQVIGRFLSPSAPYIVEDLNRDGVDEFVIRQFLKDPLNPIQVYRFGPCGFQLDKTISNYFK